MMYIQLFLSFFQISLFSFGGGYAALPLIQGQVVNVHHWLSMTEFTDLITISQMTPGPIAINAATFVGMKLTGMPGAVVATLGYITPSCIIVTIIAKLYLKYREMDMLQGILGGIRPAVVALIGSAGISILQTAFWEVSGKISHGKVPFSDEPPHSGGSVEKTDKMMENEQEKTAVFGENPSGQWKRIKL